MSRSPSPARSSSRNGVTIVGYLQRAGPARRRRLALYASNLLNFLDIADRQEDEGARGQLGRRARQGDGADPRRRGRASHLQADDGSITFRPCDAVAKRRPCERA